MGSMSANALKTLFSILGMVLLVIFIYTFFTAGLPNFFDSPWFSATLIDFIINIVGPAAWIFYKEPNKIYAVVLIILLPILGSVATSAFIVVQLLKLSPQESLQDPMYYLLIRKNNKDEYEMKSTFSSVVAARILFGALGCVMLGTLIYTIVTAGSPFDRKILTPWMIATLIDFYFNVAAISVWIAYKETSWISALFWILLLICLGSIGTCTYMVVQLFKLSSQDPLYLVLLNNRSSGFKTLTVSPESA